MYIFLIAISDSKDCGVIRFIQEKECHQHTPVEGIVMHVRNGVPAMRLVKLLKKTQTWHNCHHSASLPLHNHITLIAAL